MDRLKKLTSLLLALVMVFAMTAMAFAAEADLTGHKYVAYQIFTGTQAEDSAELGDIEWGNGVNGEALLSALKADATIGSTFAESVTAKDVAEAMAGWADKSENAKAFAKIAYANKSGDGVDCENGITSLNAGYYLVVDVTKFEEDAENTVYNLALLQLTQKGTFEIANKTDVPEVQKKVKDTNDTAGTTTDWQDSADYDIGDEVPFQLTGTVAENYADYKAYYFAFHDKQSAGLTFKADSVKVSVDGTQITTGYEVVTEGLSDGCTFEVVFKNLKTIEAVKAGSEIVVEYKAVLNENAVIGAQGNPNVVYLEYSNNPNSDWDGVTEDKPDTGKTPEDKVIVFTYQVIVNKVDKEGNALAGAGFTLYKWEKESNDWVAVSKEIIVAELKEGKATFEWKGLDDGDYKLVETTTPAGYNTIADITFTVVADHVEVHENPTLTSLSVTGADVQVKNEETGEMQTVSSFTADHVAGTMMTDVVNQTGTELPETGGMGTTMLYVVGGLLVVGAVVVMISKKKAEEK